MIDDPAESGHRFSLVSWNIFQGLHYTARRPNWHQNEEIGEHLKALDADVLVLPEAWRHHDPDATWAEDLATELGYELHQWIGDRPSRRKDICSWRMVILTRIPARRLDDAPLVTLGSLGQRAMVRVELTAPAITIAGGHLYGIHAFRRGPHHWLRERRDFREIAASVDIVAGDMNMWGPIVQRDLGDKRLVVKGRTFPAHLPHSQIDHIAVNDRIEVVESSVLSEMGSDHRAVRAVLQQRRSKP